MRNIIFSYINISQVITMCTYVVHYIPLFNTNKAMRGAILNTLKYQPPWGSLASISLNQIEFKVVYHTFHQIWFDGFTSKKLCFCLLFTFGVSSCAALWVCRRIKVVKIPSYNKFKPSNSTTGFITKARFFIHWWFCVQFTKEVWINSFSANMSRT